MAPRRPLSQPTPLIPLSEGKSCFYTYFHLSAILLGRTAYENRACEGALEPLATDSPDCPLLLHAHLSNLHVSVVPHSRPSLALDNERRL